MNREMHYIDSRHSRILKFMFGIRQVHPIFECPLSSKQAGDMFGIHIKPEDLYGNYDPNLLMQSSIEKFQGVSLRRNMPLIARDAFGEFRFARVKEVGESFVVIDFNHPLAGKELYFSITVLDVREATKREKLNPSILLKDSVDRIFIP